MSVDPRIVVCLALSLAVHAAVSQLARRLPPRPDLRPARSLAVRVLSAPSPPPSPGPEAIAPPPLAPPLRASPPKVRSRSKPVVAPVVASAPGPTPPREAPAASPAPAPSAVPRPGPPVFGVSMSSTSEAGNGPAMAVGSPAGHNSPGGGSPSGTGQGEGLGHEKDPAPVPAYEVTEMPLPKHRCSGKYTDEAMQAGIEGTVVLELVIGVDGRVRDVRVVEGLGHGLDEAAIAAMKACPFTPGRRGGEAVPVRIPTFKVHFFQNAP